MKTKMDEKQKEALVDRVIDVLHTVYDPEIPVDVYELGWRQLSNSINS